MNRRNFFKTTGIGLASIAVVPTFSALSTEPTKPIILKKNKEYWKQYFRDTTQEDNIVNYHRYIEDTYVQIRPGYTIGHTDDQIDKLPNKSGPYKIFRLHYKLYDKTQSIPTINIELTSTTILLEV